MKGNRKKEDTNYRIIVCLSLTINKFPYSTNEKEWRTTKIINSILIWNFIWDLHWEEEEEKKKRECKLFEGRRNPIPLIHSVGIELTPVQAGCTLCSSSHSTRWVPARASEASPEWGQKREKSPLLRTDAVQEISSRLVPPVSIGTN